jgi:IS4 transposase
LKTKTSKTIIEENLTKDFTPEWLQKTAKETGFIKRERKIKAVSFFWILVFGFGIASEKCLASLKRSYERREKIELSDGSWYERFTPDLVRFLKVCIFHGIQNLNQNPSRALKGKLSEFKDILIQDSTIVRLPEKLAEKWPAARTKKIAAGVKVSLLVSAIADGPKRVMIYGERTSEIRTLRIGRWVKDRVLLIDLGFFKYFFFHRIKKHHGYFVSRLKSNANPVIVAIHTISQKQSISLQGKRLKKVLPHLQGDIIDLEVEVSFKKRIYNGKRRMGTDQFRMVFIYNEEKKKYHIYLTNISPEILSAKEIAALYSARWVVELIFNELKNKYALDEISSANPDVVQAFIWVAILALIVSRRIYSLVRENVDT